MSTTIGEQLTVPFVEIVKPANRIHVRSLKVGSGREIYYLDYDMLKPGRNYRRRPLHMSEEEYFNKELGIPELAEAIFLNSGPVDPIIGDIPEGEDIFYIVEGWRRWLAIGYLLNIKGVTEYPNGSPIRHVEVLLNHKDFDGADRSLMVFQSQDKLSLRPLERGYAFRDTKEKYNLSNKEIGDRVKLSRQTVDLYIKLTELPEEVQAKVDSGEIKWTDAVGSSRKPKKGKDEAAATTDNHKMLSVEELKEKAGMLVEPAPFGESNQFIDKEVIIAGPEKPEVLTSDQPPAIIETKQALDAEFNSRKTDPNFKETRPKSDRSDALGKIDAKHQKSEAEMDFEQAIKYFDKMEIQVGHLPKSLKQAKGDLEGLCVVIKKLLIGGLDKIKRLPSGIEGE